MIVQLFHSIGLVIADTFYTLVRERRWRLMPAFVLFLLLALLLVFVKAIAPIAPFVYSLF